MELPLLTLNQKTKILTGFFDSGCITETSYAEIVAPQLCPIRDSMLFLKTDQQAIGRVKKCQSNRLADLYQKLTNIAVLSNDFQTLLQIMDEARKWLPQVMNVDGKSILSLLAVPDGVLRPKYPEAEKVTKFRCGEERARGLIEYLSNSPQWPPSEEYIRGFSRSAC